MAAGGYWFDSSRYHNNEDSGFLYRKFIFWLRPNIPCSWTGTLRATLPRTACWSLTTCPIICLVRRSVQSLLLHTTGRATLLTVLPNHGQVIKAKGVLANKRMFACVLQFYLLLLPYPGDGIFSLEPRGSSMSAMME